MYYPFLYAISIPASIIISFIIIQLYYSHKESQERKKQKAERDKEIERLLELDETESFYHKN